MPSKKERIILRINYVKKSRIGRKKNVIIYIIIMVSWNDYVY